jgi:spermidine synthase
LSHPDVRQVDLVDLDPAVTEWARSFPAMVAHNGGALDDPRVTVVHQDAFVFVEETTGTWDAIIIDLPDPHSATLARLYTTAFYALLARRLTPHGALVTQATSPFYAPEAFWTIARTMEQAVPEEHPLGPLRVSPYHLHVPSFGEWGFVLAARRELAVGDLRPNIETEVLTPESTAALFVFDQGLGERVGARLNTLDDPTLAEAYLRGWRRYND